MGHIVTYTLNAGNVLPSLLGFANINMIINFKGLGSWRGGGEKIQKSCRYSKIIIVLVGLLADKKPLHRRPR